MGEANDIGQEFEERFAELVGGTLVSGSGRGKFAKLDVRGQTILFSCKATKPTQNSISMTSYMLDEAEQATRGPSGTGQTPAMALSFAGRVLIVQDASDWLDLMISDETVDTTKAERKKRDVRVPPALREGD